jgi:hypothetical protein
MGDRIMMDRIMKKSVLIILSLMILSECLAEMSAFDSPAGKGAVRPGNYS